MTHIVAPAGHPATEKIRQKGRNKVLKSEPRPTGRERLTTRAMRLSIDLQRFATKSKTSPEDREWAEAASLQLQGLW